MIWMVWFIQTFFMIVIMLNFLIAVITSTYERVVTYQKIITFQNKAQLNEECYILMNEFITLPQFKIILLITNKEDNILDCDELADAADNLKRFINKEIKDNKLIHKELNENMISLKGNIESVANTICSKFDNLN